MNSALLRTAQIATAIAALLAVYLGWAAFAGHTVAGCGGADGCARVLGSKWAYVGPIPVGLPAAMAYAMVFGSSLVHNRQYAERSGRASGSLIVFLSATILFSVIWFIALQAIVIGNFCGLCMLSHAAGSTGAVLAAREVVRPGGRREFPVRWRLHSRWIWAGAGVVLLLILAQTSIRSPLRVAIFPAAATIQPGVPSPADVNVNANLAPEPGVVVWREEQFGEPATGKMSGERLESNSADRGDAERLPLTISLHGSRFTFRTDEIPLLGDPGAPATIVSLIDYSCGHCRTNRLLLNRMVERFAGRLSLVVLPMPLNVRCNPYFSAVGLPDFGNCEFAMLALAVWRASPEKFIEFDHWLLSDESPAAANMPGFWKRANTHAENLVGAERLARTLADPWVKRQFKTNIEIYAANLAQTGNGSMPQQFFGPVLVVGAIESEVDFLRLAEKHLALKLGD